MPIEIRLPRLGWSMDEGTFLGWLKKSGERVQTGEPLFTLENDKAAQDVEAIDNGWLVIPAGAPKAGDVVKVGELLGYLQSDDEATNDHSGSFTGTQLSHDTATVDTSDGANDKSTPAGHETPLASRSAVLAHDASELAGTNRRASPRARRAAAQHGIELTDVNNPSGSSGRICERDVLKAVTESKSKVASPVASGDQPVAVTTMRRTIAERMLQSKTNTAPVTLTCRVDATNLVAMRNQFKAMGTGPLPSFTDIIAKLSATALQKHPALTGRWEGNQIIQTNKIHIGIAVDTEEGLVVPVLRNVHTTPLVELAGRSADLIQAARSRRLKSTDVQGATFTITNLGSYGVEAFTPIINLPQAAVLGLGAIKREPVVKEDGSIAAGQLMMLSLTIDHRIVDGAPAARFLQTLRQGIENPAAWLVA